MSTGRVFQADTVGVFTPKREPKQQLNVGEVGFIIAGIKDIDAARVGDTITLASRPAQTTLPGFIEIQPRVFAGLFPVSSDDYEAFGMHWENCASTMPLYILNLNRQRHWALAFAVAFLVCCIWRLSRNGLNVNTTWI